MSEAGEPLGERPFALKEIDGKRNISAMRIQISYSVTPAEVVSKHSLGEMVFYHGKVGSNPEDFTVLVDDQGQSQAFLNAYSLDAFAIREKFVDITEPEIAWFLEHAGPFWLHRDPVSLRQFQQWQEFVKLIQLENFLDRALNEKRAGEAMQVLMGSTESFFAPSLVPVPKWGWNMAIAALHPGPEQDLVQAHYKFEQDMQVLCSWFRKPPNSAFSIEWDFPDGDAIHSMYPPEFYVANGGFAPRLRIVARNVLEAIAATIYVDRCQGIKYGKCEFCGRLFRRESDHGQKYCRRQLLDGSVVESCKNAAAQQAWRDRKKQKELLAAERRMNSKSKGKGKRR